MAADKDQAVVEWDERHVVRLRRYQEAVEAGFTDAEAELFADGGVDVGVLRRLVACRCPVGLLVQIVT